MNYTEDHYSHPEPAPAARPRTRVFRIENAQGKGCFQYDRDLDNTLVDAGVTNAAKIRGCRESELDEPSPVRHPCPFTDVPGWANHPQSPYYHCGFASIHQLLVWFDSEVIRAGMNLAGGVMRTYEVDRADVLSGRYQIMFHLDRATEVACGPIPTAAGNQTDD